MSAQITQNSVLYVELVFSINDKKHRLQVELKKNCFI